MPSLGKLSLRPTRRSRKGWITTYETSPRARRRRCPEHVRLLRRDRCSCVGCGSVHLGWSRQHLPAQRLTRRIAALLARSGRWTPRFWQYLGRPGISRRTLCRRVRQVAIWRQPKLTARADPNHDQIVGGARQLIREAADAFAVGATA